MENIEKIYDDCLVSGYYYFTTDKLRSQGYYICERRRGWQLFKGQYYIVGQDLDSTHELIHWASSLKKLNSYITREILNQSLAVDPVDNLTKGDL
jgi:hypothetical protein